MAHRVIRSIASVSAFAASGPPSGVALSNSCPRCANTAHWRALFELAFETKDRIRRCILSAGLVNAMEAADRQRLRLAAKQLAADAEALADKTWPAENDLRPHRAMPSQG